MHSLIRFVASDAAFEQNICRKSTDGVYDFSPEYEKNCR
jgi:hypothetical protein